MPANQFGGTTNFPNGVTNTGVLNSGNGQTMQTYVAPDPARVHEWFTDFDQYVAADWLVTTTGSPTETVQNADGGILKIDSASSSSGDRAYLQYKGGASASVVETFSFDSTKAMWFHSRLKVSSATNTVFVMGLQVTDTTPESCADELAFHKDASSTSLYFNASSSGTSATTALTGLATLADDTYFTCGFWWDPVLGVLNVYYNGNAVGSITSTTNIPTHTLTISFGCKNGNASQCTMSVDYIMASKDRVSYIA